MDDELKKIAPHLFENSRSEDGFRLPDDYFDQLENRVFGRIEAAGLLRQAPLKVLKKPAKRFSLPQFWMVAAAALTLALAAIWFFQPSAPLYEPIASVELSEEEIEAYVLDNVQDFEAEQLAMLPEEEENVHETPMQTTPKKSTDPLEDLTPEDIEHILKDMTEEELEEIL